MQPYHDTKNFPSHPPPIILTLNQPSRKGLLRYFLTLYYCISSVLTFSPMTDPSNPLNLYSLLTIFLLSYAISHKHLLFSPLTLPHTPASKPYISRPFTLDYPFPPFTMSVTSLYVTFPTSTINLTAPWNVLPSQ